MGFHRKAMCFVSKVAAALSTTASTAALLELRQMIWPIRVTISLKLELLKAIRMQTCC